MSDLLQRGRDFQDPSPIFSTLHSTGFDTVETLSGGGKT